MSGRAIAAPPPAEFTEAVLGELAPAGNDPELAQLLDVAEQEVAQYGIERTSLTHVARRAGVSRPTVYRRLGNKDALVRRLLVRIAAQFFSEMSQAVEGVDRIEDRAAEALVAGLRTVRTNPVIDRVLAGEGGAVATEFSTDHGKMISLLRDTVARYVDPAGELSPDQSALVAELMIRLANSFIIAPSDLVPDEGEQMRALVRACVAGAIGVAVPEEAG